MFEFEQTVKSIRLRAYVEMDEYEQLQRLTTDQRIWLATGMAGFIDSNPLETLLKLNQKVARLDNFTTGHQRNLGDVQSLVTAEKWSNFNLIKDDIVNLDDCHQVCQGVGYVLHQVALGSAPRSEEDLSRPIVPTSSASLAC